MVGQDARSTFFTKLVFMLLYLKITLYCEQHIRLNF
jgi:hypothetical protein